MSHKHGCCCCKPVCRPVCESNVGCFGGSNILGQGNGIIILIFIIIIFCGIGRR